MSRSNGAARSARSSARGERVGTPSRAVRGIEYAVRAVAKSEPSATEVGEGGHHRRCRLGRADALAGRYERESPTSSASGGSSRLEARCAARIRGDRRGARRVDGGSATHDAERRSPVKLAIGGVTSRAERPGTGARRTGRTSCRRRHRSSALRPFERAAPQFGRRTRRSGAVRVAGIRICSAGNRRAATRSFERVGAERALAGSPA